MLQNNPYLVLSETISLDNIQKMGELLTLNCLRNRCAYSRHTFEHLYVGLIQDLNRHNDPQHTFSDAYDFVQATICFLFDYIGKLLTDVYAIRKGKIITIKKAVYNLIDRQISARKRLRSRFCNIDDYSNTLSVEIDAFEEQDFSAVDATIERLGLKPREQDVLDCYMANMECYEIAQLLNIDRITVWRRRQRIQVKYKTLFNLL